MGTPAPPPEYFGALGYSAVLMSLSILVKRLGDTAPSHITSIVLCVLAAIVALSAQFVHRQGGADIWLYKCVVVVHVCIAVSIALGSVIEVIWPGLLR